MKAKIKNKFEQLNDFIEDKMVEEDVVFFNILFGFVVAMNLFVIPALAALCK